MLRSPVDNLIIRLDKAFQDEIVTESGVKLYTDTIYNPEWHVTVVGEVIAAPDKLSSRIENRGRRMLAKAGDKVIVSYMVVFDMEQQEGYAPRYNNQFYHNGAFLWKVPYFMVLGFIRDGKIIPADGYVFCEAFKEETERIGLIWVPEMAQKVVPETKARVLFKGKRKIGEPKLKVKKGDIIHYRKGMAEKYEIEGKEYLVIQHTYIYGKE